LSFRLLTIVVAWLLAWGQPACAIVADDLYRARVEVADRSGAVLADGTRQGLQQVLVKLSGSPQVLLDDQVAAELDNARVYLQQYQYLRGDEGELLLEIRYDAQLVNQLVLQSGQPLWTANRPPVLLWLVIDDLAGRRFANAETAPGLVAALWEAFERRGVPVSLPLYDLRDSTVISIHDVWQMDPQVVRDASVRYDRSDLLVGRLTAMSDGRWVADWLYLWGDGSASLSAYGQPLEELSTEAAGLVGERMAGRYAIAASGGSSSDLLLRVDGLARYRDYRATQQFLEGIELIDRAHVVFSQGSTVVFRLRAQADADELARLIGISRNLLQQRVPLPAGDGPMSDLEFMWRP
jgi:hypothetical protein